MSKRRFALFIGGMLLGAVFVYFVLVKGKKFPAWLPADRVRAQIKEMPKTVGPQAKCMVGCYNFPVDSLLPMIQQGEVLFSESETKRKPPIYKISTTTPTGQKVFVFTQADTYKNLVTILGVKPNGNAPVNCNCDSLKIY